MRLRLVHLILFAAIAAPAAARAFEPPELVPNVVDRAGVLAPGQVTAINARIEALRDRADVWAAVCLVNTLDGVSVEEAAERTFRAWELGARGRDNGLLLFFAIEERWARIEVGYGLEGDITDAYSKRVLDGVILPRFKRGDYAGGILAGLDALESLRAGDRAFLGQLPPREDETADFDWERGLRYWLWWAALVLGLPFVLRVFHVLANGVPAGRTFAGYVAGWDFTALVRGFLLVNPGVFIFFAPVILDGMGPDLERVFRSREAVRLAEYARAWLVFLLAVPVLVRVPCYVAGRLRSVPNPVFGRSAATKLVYLLDADGTWAVLRKGVLTLVPLLFFLAAALVFDSPGAGYAVALLICAVIGCNYVMQEWHDEGAALLSERGYRRKLARARLRRIHTRVEGTREVFGRTHTYHRSSSSSSSSGGGFRSSSGGGRSGGGGASSRW